MSRPAETATADPPQPPYVAYGGRLFGVPRGPLGLVIGRAPDAGAPYGTSAWAEVRIKVLDPSTTVNRRNVQVVRAGEWLWARLIDTRSARAVLLSARGDPIGEIGDGTPGTPLRDGQQIRLLNHVTVGVVAKTGPNLRKGKGANLGMLAEAIVLCEAGSPPRTVYDRYRNLSNNSDASDKTLQRKLGELADALGIDSAHRGTGRSRDRLHSMRRMLLSEGRPAA